MVFGPAEAFTPEQLAELYDINVLSTQRMNRAALPILRKHPWLLWQRNMARERNGPWNQIWRHAGSLAALSAALQAE